MSEEAKKPQPINVEISPREAMVLEGAQNLTNQLRHQLQMSEILKGNMMMTHLDGKGLVEEKTKIIAMDLKDGVLTFYPEGADVPEPEAPEQPETTTDKRGNIDA